MCGSLDYISLRQNGISICLSVGAQFIRVPNTNRPHIPHQYPPRRDVSSDSPPAYTVYPGHLWVGDPLTPKKLTISSHTAAKLCTLNFLSAGAMNHIKYITETLLTGNEHRELFVVKQSKGCKFMPKMHRNTFGSARTRWGSLCAPES